MLNISNEFRNANDNNKDANIEKHFQKNLAHTKLILSSLLVYNAITIVGALLLMKNNFIRRTLLHVRVKTLTMTFSQMYTQRQKKISRTTFNTDMCSSTKPH